MKRIDRQSRRYGMLVGSKRQNNWDVALYKCLDVPIRRSLINEMLQTRFQNNILEPRLGVDAVGNFLRMEHMIRFVSRGGG